jgi:hypothetical protein
VTDRTVWIEVGAGRYHVTPDCPVLAERIVELLKVPDIRVYSHTPVRACSVCATVRESCD